MDDGVISLADSCPCVFIIEAAAQVHKIQFGLWKAFSASVVFLAGWCSLIVAHSLPPLSHYLHLP